MSGLLAQHEESPAVSPLRPRPPRPAAALAPQIRLRKGRKVVSCAGCESYNYSLKSKSGNEFDFGFLTKTNKVFAVAIVGQLSK